LYQRAWTASTLAPFPPAATLNQEGGETGRTPIFVVGELFDDAEPEPDSLAEAMDDFDRIETFRAYVRDGLNELQDWLRDQPGA
jgi:hypothetical protein